MIPRLAAWIALAGSVAPAGGDVDVQGHRGCRGLLPENSLAGFERAVALGVTTLELDLQATRDRVLVAYHDQHLDPARCIRDDGRRLRPLRIKDLDYADLAAVDCGTLAHPRFPRQQRVPGSRIPRLEQVLALARDAPYPVRLNIEIKMQKPEDGIPVAEFARLLVEAVRAHGLERRVTIQSFHPPALIAVRDLAPGIPRAILVVHRRHYEARLGESDADILSPRYQGLRRGDVERFHRRGIPVLPWTVNKPADIRRLLDQGVDGIISDYPDRVLEILRESGRRPLRPPGTPGSGGGSRGGG